VGDRGLVERHVRDHRRVSQCLEFHVTAVQGPLELDHDQAGVPIEGQEVDAPPAVLPVSELLAQDHGTGDDDLQVVAQDRLEVLPLADPGRLERDLFERLQHAGPEPVDGHDRSIPCAAR